MLFLVSIYSSGQNRKACDSLLHVIQSTKNDTTRIYSYLELAWQLSNIPDSAAYFTDKGLESADFALSRLKDETTAYTFVDLAKASVLNQKGWSCFLRNKNKEALQVLNQSLKISEKYKASPDTVIAKKAKRLRANSLLNMGPVYSSEANYPVCIGQYQEGLKLFEELGDKNGISRCYTNIGVAWYLQSNYSKALEYYFKALKIGEETDNKRSQSFDLTNIATIYKSQKNYDKALEYYFKVLNINKEVDNKMVEANVLGSIGSIYNSQDDHARALEYTMKALELNTRLGNKYGQTINCTSIGNVYDAMKNYDQALEYHFRSLKLDEEGGFRAALAVSCSNIGKIYTSIKKYRVAESFLTRGLVIAEEQKALESIKEINKNLAELYDLTNRPALAYRHFRQFVQARDSISNDENTKNQTRAEMSYEFDKKEAIAKSEQDKKDAITAEEKQQQQIVIIAVSIGLLLVLILAAVIFRSLRNNQKKNRIIEQQKKDVETQKQLIEEKHKEITDSINYAERIQRSFLATKEMLDTYLQDYFVFFLPKDVVSGDFYWAAELTDNNFALVTADSTGHGVPGAIMSILNISSLEKAIETETQASALLNATRQIIIDRLKKDGSAEGGKDGMDCSIVILDKDNMQLAYAAANNPVWIVRQNQLMEFKADKMPVGKHDKQDIPFTQHAIDLQKGDVVYTLTDGFPDQFGGTKGKKYLSKRLKDFLVSISGFPMSEQHRLLAEEFNAWKGETGQVDDVTVIGIKV
jgi:serine phosphatase RsbU (regulator of sigma subunit)